MGYGAECSGCGAEPRQPSLAGKRVRNDSAEAERKVPFLFRQDPRKRRAQVTAAGRWCGRPGRRRALRFRAARLLPLTRARSLTKVHFVSEQEGVRQPGRPAVAHLWPHSLSAPWRRRVQANQNAGGRDSRDPQVQNRSASLRGEQLHDSLYVHVTKNT